MQYPDDEDIFLLSSLSLDPFFHKFCIVFCLSFNASELISVVPTSCGPFVYAILVVLDRSFTIKSRLLTLILSLLV